MIASYRDLKVWQEAMDVVEACYQLTHDFPREEAFGMTSQIRRSAASVPANIAEGYGRDGRREFVHFLRLAQGSLKELETHLLISQRVGLARSGEVELILEQTSRLGKMILTLYRTLQQKEHP